MRAFDFCSITEQKYVLCDIENSDFIDITWRCLKSCLINSDNLVIFKFRDSKFDLKDNFANN